MNDLQGAAKIIVLPFVHADASLHAELWEGVPVTGVISSLLSGVKQVTATIHAATCLVSPHPRCLL